MIRLIAAALAVGCAAPARQTIDTPPVQAAAITHTIIGVLDLVIGDPASGAGSERILAALVDSIGNRTPLVLVREQLDGLGPDARKPGFRVRVVGEPATLHGAPALRVLSISATPPA